MPPSKKRFTEDFIAKWSKTSDTDDDAEELLKRQKSLLTKDPKNAKLWLDYGKTLLSLGFTRIIHSNSKRPFDE
jgi:hypothetical protein